MYTFDENTVSDLHKDARGFRPTQIWWESWVLSSDDRKQDIWDSLIEEFNETMNIERLNQTKARLDIEKRIRETRALGASNDKEALKWIMEAEEFSDYDLQYGADYFCYHFGLSYADKEKFPIQEAMNEMLSEVV